MTIDKSKEPSGLFTSKKKSYYFNESSSIESNETKVISNFRRILPQILAVGVKNLVLFGYGLTLGFPTIVIPDLKANGKTTDEEISWFGSINLLCVPMGCFFSGILTEPTGKRRAMQIIEIPIFISWILFYFSSNIYHLYAALCLVGVSGGLMEASVLTYVAEVTEAKYRGMLTVTGTTCVVIGHLVQFVLGTYLKWRQIALICSALPILTIIALFCVPESPYWLLTKNRSNEARKSLAWLRGWVEPHKVDDEFNEIHQALIDKKQVSEDKKTLSCTERLVPLTKRSFLLPFAIVTGTLFVGCFAGKTSIQTYAVEIFRILETPIDKHKATVLLGVCEFVGAIFCILLVRFTGKRPLILLSTVGSAICFSLIAFYAYHYGVSSDANHTITDRPTWIPLTLILTSAWFMYIGIAIIPWTLIGEMFPTDVRSAGSGLSSGFGYLFGFVANKMFLWMLSTITLAGTFWFYAIIMIISCIVFYFVLPETEGKSLLEIEAHFVRRQRLK